MVLKVHHLGISQSERITWLLEELQIPYDLIKYVRDPVLSPESLKSVPGNSTGKSPFVEDTETGVQLSESGAIVEYIIHRYGHGKLAVSPSEDPRKYVDYLYWFHYANGTLQPAMLASMFTGLTGAGNEVPIVQFAQQRLEATLQQMDDRLRDHQWLAGEDFTAADVMSAYPLTTQRYFGPQVTLAPYEHILRWLRDCAAREGYRRGMEKGDADMEPLIGAEAPKMGMMEAGGTKSDHWRRKQ